MSTTIRLFTAILCVTLAGAFTHEAAVAAEQVHQLRSAREPGQIDRVTVLLEGGGDVYSPGTEGKADQTRKMSVVCNLAFDERTLEVPGPATAGPWRSVRSYETASAVLKVGDGGLKPALRPERSLIVAESDGQTATLFSPSGPLSRDELELIEVQGNSLLLDQFLPEEPVAVGGSWRHGEKLMELFLRLDAVSQADVHSTLRSVTDTAAKMELTGRVDGAQYGVSVEIELKAKYRFDLRAKRIDWFALLVKEKRGPSPVMEGVDGVSRLQIQIVPKADSPRLTDAALSGMAQESTPESRQLVYSPADAAWQLTYDRSWHMCWDRPDLTVLRLVDRGEYISQCNVSSLAEAGSKEVTLAEFQEDVKKALGESFGEFVEAGQRASQRDYREYRVVVRGKVSEVPIQWVYYLVTEQQGRQVALTFTVEQGLLDRFGEVDRRLLDAFRFLETKTAEKNRRPS